MCYNVVYAHPYSISLKRVNISRIYKEKEGHQAQLSPFSFVHTPFLSLLYDVFRPHTANLKSSRTIVDDVSYLLSRQRCLRQADAKRPTLSFAQSAQTVCRSIASLLK